MELSIAPTSLMSTTMRGGVVSSAAARWRWNSRRPPVEAAPSARRVVTRVGIAAGGPNFGSAISSRVGRS